MSFAKPKFDNITNPVGFNVQAFAQKGWRVLAAGENTDTITRSPDSGGHQAKAVGDGECYRVIYAPDGGTITCRFHNGKGDQLSSQVVPEGFMMEGLFEMVTNAGSTSIYVSIA